MSIFLSIIVPTYNRAHLIAQTLQCILKQTDSDYEVIVIDDGSTDETEKVVAPFLCHNVHYHRINNSERGAARNVGTSLAKGKYVNWFDSDDEMLPNHVHALKNVVTKFGAHEFFALKYAFKDAETKAILPKSFEQKGLAFPFIVKGNYLACNPVCVRRDIALKEPFIEDRKLSASEDYELWLRLWAKYPLFQSDELTSYLILHAERSVNTMKNPTQLEERFLSFIYYTSNNAELKQKLGNHFHYFLMRNYLLLAVDLAYNGFGKKGWHYLKVALKTDFSAARQRLFWATIKHLFFK